jgi:phospholipid/cholesterol/gamma-HCH transport system permease protein
VSNSVKVYHKDNRLICEGEWDLPNLFVLENLLNKINLPKKDRLIIDGSKITKMDSAGAWLLCKWLDRFSHAQNKAQLENFSKQADMLIKLVEKNQIKDQDIPEVVEASWLVRLGKLAVDQFKEFYNYLNFIGKLTIEFIRITSKPAHIRWKAFLSSIDRTGLQALPIIGLLSFMIGVVLAYQMGVQLRNYGANVFVVDLLGLSVLREFGPLLTAIMAAGRTGSSFTAELGIMKINQEIDALDTMGVTPAELLLLPKITGLFIALPLLTVWSDIFGVFGGMFMANTMLDISWYEFLNRFSQQVPLRALLLGLGKAPVFALIISTIGCYQGMAVRDTADSIGINTTKSVVLSIFFIILADAAFSIIFSKLQL